jgi:hypothetical protein
LFAAVATIMAFTGFREPMTTEVGLNALLADPTGAIPRALTLSYTPWLLDILKLYIVLLLALPGVLWVYGRSRIAVAGFSLTLYAMAHHFDWFTLTEYPRALAWFWNPFSWQLLFLGAAVIGFQNDQGWRVPRHPALHALAGCLVISAAYLAHNHLLGPGWTDRQTLAPAHLVSFAAVAYLASGLLHPGWRFWKSTIARPIVACGQHSLLVFCTGVLVSYGLSLALERTTSRVVEALIIAGGVAIAMLAGLAAGPLGPTKATRTGATAADITEVPTPADATSVMPAREIEPLLVHSCSTTVLSPSRRQQAPSCAEPDGTGAEVNAETVPV